MRSSPIEVLCDDLEPFGWRVGLLSEQDFLQIPDLLKRSVNIVYGATVVLWYGMIGICVLGGTGRWLGHGGRFTETTACTGPSGMNGYVAYVRKGKNSYLSLRRRVS